MRDEPQDMNRRDVLRRAALVGGVTVWATPVVQSLSGTAWARTSGSVAVEGTKTPGGTKGAGGTEVQGDDLAGTGSTSPTELIAAGAGLVVVGSAAVAAARHRRKAVPADDDV